NSLIDRGLRSVEDRRRRSESWLAHFQMNRIRELRSEIHYLADPRGVHLLGRNCEVSHERGGGTARQAMMSSVSRALWAPIGGVMRSPAQTPFDQARDHHSTKRA